VASVDDIGVVASVDDIHVVVSVDDIGVVVSVEEIKVVANAIVPVLPFEFPPMATVDWAVVSCASVVMDVVVQSGTPTSHGIRADPFL